jgi:hypothetical protein
MGRGGQFGKKKKWADQAAWPQPRKENRSAQGNLAQGQFPLSKQV